MMRHSVIYTLSLIGFFVMCGLFGSLAAAPRSRPMMQATALPQSNAQVVPGATARAVIPVTGEAPDVAGIFLVYGLVGLGALLLILALITTANKQTALYVRRKKPPE